MVAKLIAHIRNIAKLAQSSSLPATAFTVSIVLNIVIKRTVHEGTADAELKKSKNSGIIICTCNLQQFELICYESIDILQAPRLVNNPFAYATYQQSFLWEGVSSYESDEKKLPIKHFFRLHALKKPWISK
ncbi:hypothetical protein TNCV_3544001 [Trichonephila clavipes]|nr:hypothetical protein TNCV_3544001 [Trichonephila clavipes]